MTEERDPRRTLPSVERVVQALAHDAPHRTKVRAARRAIDEARTSLQQGEMPGEDSVVQRASGVLASVLAARLRPVLNATGVLIHTNLGRVGLSDTQLDAVGAIASGYSNLEYDVEAGERGDRYAHASDVLCEVTGAEAALVVNNNAAAVLVVLAALCTDREVVISRGELIEIGGAFRIPDVLTASGARLVEVGTTNRTHLADYKNAITDGTGAILKVHPSNYRIVGFTRSVHPRELAAVAREAGVPFVHDLGSGLLASQADASWLADEVPVQVALEDGADIVTFSGDKLLGGPQAGVIVGRRELVDRVRRHPLMRALRVDKMTLAALEVTVAAYLDESYRDLPLWRLALAEPDVLESRARALATTLGDLADSGVKVEAVASEARTGGGSLPGQDLASWAVAVESPARSADEMDRALRAVTPPVIGRIADGRLLLDLRSIDPEDDALLGRLLRQAIVS